MAIDGKCLGASRLVSAEGVVLPGFSDLGHPLFGDSPTEMSRPVGSVARGQHKEG